jgi:hypothetical protein
MLVAAAVGQLHQAQPVAARIRPIASVSTAIGPGRTARRGQVFFVEMMAMHSSSQPLAALP